jgi:Rha family phage regulatory protein
MENLVFKSEKGAPITNSLLVAQKFGKRHADVLRDIRNLHCSENFQQRNFALLVEMKQLPQGGAAKAECYIMTKDGFAFLVMGYTGKEAGKFKEDYIEAFNKMEEVIKTGGFQIPRSYSEALMLAAKQAEQIEQQEKQLLIQAPKVKYHDEVLSSDNLMPISVIAQNYGMTGERLNGILRICGIQYKQGKHWIITAKYKNRDYARIIPDVRYTKDGKSIVINQMKWTETGRKFIHNLLVENGFVIRQKCLAI